MELCVWGGESSVGCMGRRCVWSVLEEGTLVCVAISYKATSRIHQTLNFLPRHLVDSV